MLKRRRSTVGGKADAVIHLTLEAGRVQARKDAAFKACPRRRLVGLTRGKLVTTTFGDSDFHCQCSDPFWGECSAIAVRKSMLEM